MADLKISNATYGRSTSGSRIIQNKIKKYNNVLTSVLENDRAQFEKSQSNIANTISSNIKI